MAAVTTSAIGAGLGIFQAAQGLSRTRKGESDLANFERQDLKNSYEDMPISTVGTDLLREESGRTAANMVDAVRGSDSRAVLGAIPKIQAGTNQINKEAQAYIDNEVNKRNYAIAGDKSAIREIRENRDNADLAGIGREIEVGRQDMWSGLRAIGSSAMYAANNMFGSASKSGSGDFKDANLPKDIGYTPYYSLPKLQGGY